MVRALGIALGIALASTGCGGKETPVAAPIPVRATTAGDALLALAPAGADLLLEIDIARLRSNPIAGNVLEAMSAPGGETQVVEGDLLAQASSILVCVYGVGASAKQLVILQAVDDFELQGAAAIGKGRYAVGEPALVARAVALGGNNGTSMVEDAELLRLRAQVMPAEAQAAAVRAVARLDFEARVAVASRVGMSEVPVSLALWGDVVDDLAIVARVTGEDPQSHEELQRALISLGNRVAKRRLIRFLGLAPALAAARVTRSGEAVQVVLVLSPKRFALLAERLVRQLQLSHQNASQPSASHD